jgi:hypothetical protein
MEYIYFLGILAGIVGIISGTITHDFTLFILGVLDFVVVYLHTRASRRCS